MPKRSESGTFLGDCIQLYDDMLAEIKVCKKKQSNEEERILTCFEIVENYKDKVNEAVRNHDFKNSADEIYFFKNVKPLFHAEAEFYTYCYHNILFKTKELNADKQELRDFYQRQLAKKEKMRKEHPVFCEYVQEKKTYADMQWFTRGIKNSDSSLFDNLMGKYLAIEKFEVYLMGIMNREL